MNNKTKSRLYQQFAAGFTLVEILLVIGMLAFLAVIIMPITLDFYKSQQLDTHTRQIIQTLRMAQLSAMSVEEDSNFGVYLTNDNYTLFRGSSYVARETQYDEVFDLPQIINISGLSEAVFSKLDGLPSATGQIILTNNIKTNTIDINGMGRVNLGL